MCAQSNTAPSSIETTDRLATAAVGLALLAPVLWRRSAWRFTAAAAGSLLLYRAATGQPGVYLQFASPASHANPDPVQAFLTIGQSAEDLHSLWRDPGTLPTIARDVAEVTAIDQDHARWSLPLPAGKRLEWQTAILNEDPGQSIYWRSTPDSPIHNEGWLQMRPAPQGHGTEVTLKLAFTPANGLAQPLAKLLKPLAKTATRKLLRNFKSFAETGEVPTLDGNTSARQTGSQPKGDLL